MDLIRFALKNSFLRRCLANRISEEGVQAAQILHSLMAPPGTPLPMDLAPMAARQLVRGVLTAVLVPTLPGWIWPRWIVRQFDPADPCFVPRAHQPAAINLTGRNWTPVGVPGTRTEAHVDPAGWVTPRPFGPSIDCWVHDGDRLWVPSHSRDLTQRFLADEPAVLTEWRAGDVAVEHKVWPACRSGGGGASGTVRRSPSWLAPHSSASRPLQSYDGRLAGVPATPPPPDLAPPTWTGVVVTVRLRLLGDQPRAGRLVLSLRPANAEGLAPVQDLVWESDSRLMADGREVLCVVEQPAGVLLSNREQGDVALRLGEEPSDSMLPLAVRCEAGLANAALVYPYELKPGEDVSVSVLATVEGEIYDTATLSELRRAYRTSKIDPAAVGLALPAPDELRSAAAERYRPLETAFDVDVPDQRLVAAFRASRAHLLGLWDGDQITPGPATYHHFWFRDAAFLVSGLDRLGLHAQAASVLATYPRRQREDGLYLSQDGEWDSAGQGLWALVQHARLTADPAFLAGMWPSMRRAAAWIERTRRSTPHGLMPAGLSAEHLGPPAVYYWDALWGAGGLLATAEAARVLLNTAAGGAEARLAKSEAAQWEAAGREFLAMIEASWLAECARLKSAAPPGGPGRNLESAMIGNLPGWYPLQILPADDGRLWAQLAALRDLSFVRGGFYQSHVHCGINPYLTAQWAMAAIMAGRPEDAWPAVQNLLDTAHPTWTWPEAVHPTLNTGCMGDGSSGWSTADFLHLVRHLAYVEENDALVLWPGAPATWWTPGHRMNFRNAATRFGRVDCTLSVDEGKTVLDLNARWHGEPPRVFLALPGGGRTPVCPGADGRCHFAVK